MIRVYFTTNNKAIFSFIGGDKRTADDSPFLRTELHKLGAIEAHPLDARGEESPELSWLPGTGGAKLLNHMKPQLTQLLDYVEKM